MSLPSFQKTGFVAFQPQVSRLQQFTKRPWFRFSIQPDQQNENANLVNEFRNNQRFQPCDGSFKFKFSEQTSMWLPKQPFFRTGVLIDILKQGEWDLSFITEIFQNEQASMKAIEFCYTGFILVHEQHELTQFLLACFLMQVGQPFTWLTRELQLLQNSVNLVLEDPSELLDIDIFIQKCQSSQMYAPLVSSSKPNPMFESLQNYSQYLLKANPTYYIIPESNTLNPKLRLFSLELFKTSFLGYFGSSLFMTLDANGHVSFENVQKFYNMIYFYFTRSDGPAQAEQLQQIESTFVEFYPLIKDLLTEEDQMACLQFTPSNSSNVIQMLRQKMIEIKEIVAREKALRNILIAQLAQSIYTEKYSNSFKGQQYVLTGIDVTNKIEQLLNEEIHRLKNPQEVPQVELQAHQEGDQSEFNVPDETHEGEIQTH